MIDHLHAGPGKFNGFGARGALSIPWYAGQFSAHLLHRQPLPQEADLQRYQQLL